MRLLAPPVAVAAEDDEMSSIQLAMEL